MPPQTNNSATPPLPPSQNPDDSGFLLDPNQLPQPGRRIYKSLRALSLVILVAIFGVIALQQWQPVSDWLRLRGYEPPAAVSKLAADTTMTASATHLLYLNKPQILPKTSFSPHCPISEKSIVLGCYHAGENGIYMLQIADDPQLQGVMQVTAAHEMLHAAYDRLSHSEKSWVNALLQDFYNNHLTDPAVKQEIDNYRSSEPNDVINEMHSILGTEVMQLTPQLEQYYKRYFTNRVAVAQAAAHYRSAFESREQIVHDADAKLAELKTQIESNNTVLRQQADALNAQVARLQGYKAAGQLYLYNSDVTAYNRHVNAYNALLAQTKQLIADYNELVVTRNAAALQASQLVSELSGNTLPAPAK